MAKRLWCVLLTAVMLLNLLPVGLADNEGLEEPIPATVEIQQEVQEEAQQEIIEEPLPAPVDSQLEEPEEEAAEEPLPDEEEPESLEEAAEEPEEEAAEEALPTEEKTELVEELPGEMLDILTIPGEEQPDDERPDMLMATALELEDEEIVEEEEDDDQEENRALSREELAKLGIVTDEPVYRLTKRRETISSGTYTITENVDTIYGPHIDGKVKIILPDNLKLNCKNGLRVNPGNELTITVPQGSKGNGQLICNSGVTTWAGIGGRSWQDGNNCGKITIEGGIIEAHGGAWAAGIGGGRDGNGGTVIINGGTVNAGGNWGAGIGGGTGGSGGTVIINGGTVNANGSHNGAGIGGGAGCGAGTVTINGGTVNASGYAAGIGVGSNGAGGTITINGGEVKAHAGADATGIGGRGVQITINHGKVTATGGEDTVGIGGSRDGYATSITIHNGSEVTATGGANAAGIGAGDVVISSSSVTAQGGWNGAGIGAGDVVISSSSVTARGGVNAAGIGGCINGSAASITISDSEVTAIGGENAAAIGTGANGVGGSISIITSKVSATGGKNAAGIGGGSKGYCDKVTVSGGTVETTGGQYGAGIGGGANSSRGEYGTAGEVIIDNGTVTAQGGEGAAGIGGGQNGGGGTVTINNGTIKATGGRRGTGIGGGEQGYGSAIFINNGTVEAYGGQQAAGIGVGVSERRAGTIAISGGTVTANGMEGAAGICVNKNDSLTIKAAEVTAVGGNNGTGIGAGIGGGANSSAGGVTIHSGTVNARGGWGSAGIGGGTYGNGANVIIRGGTVTAIGGWDAAGIGGGVRGSGDNVQIYDGIVTARGNEPSTGIVGVGVGGGAGIGGGIYGGGGSVAINGGKVTASSEGYGAGIGGGQYGGGGSVAFNGGTTTAIGGGSGIGGRISSGIGRGVSGRSAGILYLLPGLNVINLSDDRIQTQILAPTAQKLDGVRKVLVGKFLPEPIAAALPYNGREQSGYPNPGQPTRVEGTTAAKELGNYEFTVTPGTGYTWTDGTNAAKTLNWSIGRAKATVKANDRAIAYGDKEPELTATVRGTVNGDRLNYQISRDPGKDAGKYIIMPSGEAIQGHYDVAYESGTLTIRPKNVSAIRESDFQTIAAGTGDFTAPTFRDRALDEDIPGTLTYAYNRRRMTEEELRNTLSALPTGSRGTITWSYEAEGNFAGTITGRIDFVISGIEFTVDSRTADASNAVTIKNNPTYGDTWEELVTISDRIVVSVGRETGSGQYTLNVSGTPNAGRQTYSVLFNGSVNRVTYTNVTVLTGEVDIARADYKDVNKTASGEIEPEVGRSVIIPLPEIPQGASYGTPRKTIESDPYRLFAISGNQIPVSLTDIPETNPMTFTVPVNPDGNHNGYDITATLTVRSGAHTHFFRYTASGHQITAVCRAANCPLPESKLTLTLNAPASLTYDGSVREAAFADGEAEAWKAATGSDVPRITYTADRGSALTGGKPVNAGSYTASINVYGQRASLRFTVAKTDYADVTKEASADLNAARNSRVSVTLPAIPNGTRYGTPVKANRNDPYSLSGISANRITVTSSGIPQDVNAVSFTVPVIPDANHNGYTVTVTVNVIQPKITVSAKVSRGYLRTGLLLLRRVPTYTATITAGYTEPSAQPLRVAYSLTGYYYTPGSQFTSLLPIQRFYIRVTDPNGVHYYYRYENGRTVPR